jgi:hypothetical protein
MVFGVSLSSLNPIARMIIFPRGSFPVGARMYLICIILCKPQTPQGSWVNCRLPGKGDRRPFCIFLDQKSYPYFFLPPCPSKVYHLTRSHQLPILQNYWVNNLPTDYTFPSPIVFLETVKLVINHGPPAAKTLHKKQFIH